MDAELPVGTVTFLFTDIEGSTRLLRALGERYGEALGEHHTILRGCFLEHSGREIDTQGDAFFVAFRRARDAVAAAADGQRRLSEHDWPEGEQLRVRMGIHTGEPASAGVRYVGMGVHRAARICAAGHGGQVLLSQTTRELLRDDPLPGVSLRDLGRHQLKDMDEPERLYQLVGPGLEQSFPPLGGAETARRWRVAVPAVCAAIAVAAAAWFFGRGGSSAPSVPVGADQMAVINATSGRLIAAPTVGASPGGVAAGYGSIWVANTTDNTVTAIDARSGRVRQTVTDVNVGPDAVTTGGGDVWVADGVNGRVSRIDPTDYKVVQRIHVGNGPAGIAYGAGAVWVANSVDGTVTQIDARSGRVKAVLPAVPGATGIAFLSGRVWVVSPATGQVVELDPSSGAVSRIGVGVDPSAITAGAGAIWVANRYDDTVSRINPSAQVDLGTVTVGRSPDGLAAAAGQVWVANGGDGTVSRIDPAAPGGGRVTQTVRLSNSPQGVAISGGQVYVAVRSNGGRRRGETLRVSGDPPDSIDPAVAYSPEAWSVLSMTNDGLVGYRRVGGIQGVELVPDLAESLPTPTDGGTTYTFQLRPGLRYSTGRAIQPADIRTGIERVLEMGSPGARYYSDIVGARSCHPGKPCDLSSGIVADPSARTVSFHLTSPNGDFLAELALTFAVAVPAAPPHDIGTHPVPATGPYMISAYRKGHSLTLVRNPRFRQWSADAQPQGYPDRIDWTFRQPDSQQSVRAVERGAADVAVNLEIPPLPKRQLLALAQQYSSQLHLTPLSFTNFFFLNTRVAPFNNLSVRLAVNDAFDRRAYARVLGPGYAPTCQILPPNFPAFHRTCPYASGSPSALAQARTVIRNSGSAGAKVTVWAPAPRAIEGRLMVSLLDRLGFHAILQTPAAPAYFAHIEDSRTRAQIGFYGWGSDFPADAGFLPPLFACSAFVPAAPARTLDPSEFCSSKVDALLADATVAQSQNPARAAGIWQQAERLILSQAPVVPTYNKEDVSFLAKRVGNFQYNPQWGVLLDQLWVK